MSDFIRFKLSAGLMNFLCWFLLLAPALVYLCVGVINYGFMEFFDKIMSVPALHSLPLLILVYILHEGLHVVAGMIAGVQLRSFSFGFDKRSLSIECICKQDISIRAYHLMLLFPFVVLTPILFYLALVSGTQLWWIIFVLSVSGCAFDLVISIGIAGIPGSTRIVPEIKGENGYVYLRSA